MDNLPRDKWGVEVRAGDLYLALSGRLSRLSHTVVDHPDWRRVEVLARGKIGDPVPDSFDPNRDLDGQPVLSDRESPMRTTIFGAQDGDCISGASTFSNYGTPITPTREMLKDAVEQIKEINRDNWPQENPYRWYMRSQDITKKQFWACAFLDEPTPQPALEYAEFRALVERVVAREAPKAKVVTDWVPREEAAVVWLELHSEKTSDEFLLERDAGMLEAELVGMISELKLIVGDKVSR